MNLLQVNLLYGAKNLGDTADFKVKSSWGVKSQDLRRSQSGYMFNALFLEF